MKGLDLRLSEVIFLSPEGREKMLEFWLFISAFGIMFAVLSWLQEASILPSADELKAWKGVLAVVSGAVLYWSVARNITGGANDE